MTLLGVLGYIADAFILGTYGAWVMLDKPGRWFHIANALGGPVLLVIEVQSHAWQVIPLTGTFTVLGWLGWVGGDD